MNIGYLPGWITPPTANQLYQAGYTHVLVAFGVFSTTQPGVVISAFSQPNGVLSAAYFAQLQSLGIKVLLSIGGASSSIANTGVNFHQVVSLAPNSTVFINTFVTSVQSLISQYNFDGVDFDIEQGFGPATGGTITNPGGDIQILASIITKLYNSNPKLLITLAPQTANISPKNAPISITWGNYASLIVQSGVASALKWVGIQLYNTGCTNGINGVCYADTGTSPDYGVAMAVDLLENWPATLNGRTTGWPAYISPLVPSQIVLGYPSPNNQGNSDGAPATASAIIKKSLSCLASKSNCDTYVPPRAYGQIGGVFNWQIDNDALNNFQFALSFKS